MGLEPRQSGSRVCALTTLLCCLSKPILPLGASSSPCRHTGPPNSVSRLWCGCYATWDGYDPGSGSQNLSAPFQTWVRGQASWPRQRVPAPPLYLGWPWWFSGPAAPGRFSALRCCPSPQIPSGTWGGVGGKGHSSFQFPILYFKVGMIDNKHESSGVFQCHLININLGGVEKCLLWM